MGRTIVGLWDINQDGHSDFALYNSWDWQAAPGPHFLRIFLGGERFQGPPSDALPGISIADADVTTFVPVSYAWSGAVTITGARDVNGDGYDDFMVGVPHSDDLCGRVGLFYGGPAIGGGDYLKFSQYNASFVGEVARTATENTESWQVMDMLGDPICSAGDFNGDGFGDILLGAPSHSANWEPAGGNGRVYMIPGGGDAI